MTEDVKFILIVAAGGVILLALIAYNRKRTLDRLKEAYIRKPAEFLELLEDRFVKMTLTQKERMAMKLDGCLAAGNAEGAKQTIGWLDTAMLSNKERVTYYYKRLTFFVSIRDAVEAPKSFDMLRQSVELCKESEKQLPMLEQSRIMLEVFIYRNLTLIPELQAGLKQQEDSPEKGMTEYLLARLYYAAGDMGAATEAATRALLLLRGTPWETAVRAATVDARALGN